MARVLILVVVALVATLLTLGSIWIANYAPLVQGSLGSSTDRTDVKMVRVDAFDMRGTVFTVPTGRTATFRYRLSISNSGPAAVRIDSIGTSAGSVGVGTLTRRAVEVIPDPWRSSGPIGFTSEEHGTRSPSVRAARQWSSWKRSTTDVACSEATRSRGSGSR